APVLVCGPATEADGAVRDARDAQTFVVREPLVEHLAVLVGIDGVLLVPVLCRRERVLGAVMEDPRVAPRALDPAPDRLRLLVIGIGGPGDSDRAESALVQVRGDLAHDLLAHAVAFHAAV